MQCLGISKKKGTRCKNAALLEYIGPRPLYCAEHIEEDPNSLYSKCKCSYFKEVGDGKPCKQVVLKELVMCYKHFHEVLYTLPVEKARRQKNLVGEMVNKLKQDAKAFHKTNTDLYQRKTKLLPKYIKLEASIARYIEEKEQEQARNNPNNLNPSFTGVTQDQETQELSESTFFMLLNKDHNTNDSDNVKEF